MGRSHVYLVPGFFGFGNAGDLPYFAHVREILIDGRDRDVVVVEQPPTSSLRQRAAHLAECIAATSTPEGFIHLVGHSSGGLDARLMLTPGVSLQTDVDVEACARRVSAVVTIATPHRGTPLASFFTGLLGQQLLQLLSLSTIHTLKFGSLPLGTITRLVKFFGQAEKAAKAEKTEKVEKAAKNRNSGFRLSDAYMLLLTDFTRERRAAIDAFLRDIQDDQALLPQLSPDSMDLFNASTLDRETVRYGSVVAVGRKPGFFSTLAAGFDPYAHATHMLYAIMFRLSTRMPAVRTNDVRGQTGSGEQTGQLEEIGRLQQLGEPRELGQLQQRGRIREAAPMQALEESLGRSISWSDSDGIVPSLSQVFGEVIHAVHADHLDVIGHFGDHLSMPPHHDWLASGSHFKRADFESLWTTVRTYLDRAEATRRALVAGPAASVRFAAPRVAAFQSEEAPRVAISQTKEAPRVGGRLFLRMGPVNLHEGTRRDDRVLRLLRRRAALAATLVMVILGALGTFFFLVESSHVVLRALVSLFASLFAFVAIPAWIRGLRRRL